MKLFPKVATENTENAQKVAEKNSRISVKVSSAAIPLCSSVRSLRALWLPAGETSAWEWAPSLQNALDAYPKIRASRGFDERLWAALEGKRARRATLGGRAEDWIQTEIGGVAVWRVLGSSLAGAALPFCVLLWCCAGPSNAAPVSPLAPRWATPFNQRRFWEEAAWKTPAREAAPLVPLDPQFWNGGALCPNA